MSTHRGFQRTRGPLGLLLWTFEKPFCKMSNARMSTARRQFPSLNCFRFPDVGYFRDPEIQSDLTNILFIYSLQNPVLGYRQGMHELLALLYYACDFDSISEEQAERLENRKLGDLFSRAWVAADAYTLFLAIMRGVGRWYEWREPPAPLQTGLPSPNPGSAGLQPYMAPIVEACNRIQSTYLKSVDPDLWKHLQASGIEAQIYGM